MKRLTVLLVSLTLLFAAVCMSGCFNRHDDNKATGKKFTHSGVDLGLPSGNIWASYNVGAHAPEERGYYIEWIDTKELVEKFNWEKGWRVPTEDEWVELYQNCTYTLENRQDHNGKTIGGMVFRASNGNVASMVTLYKSIKPKATIPIMRTSFITKTKTTFTATMTTSTPRYFPCRCMEAIIFIMKCRPMPRFFPSVQRNTMKT